MWSVLKNICVFILRAIAKADKTPPKDDVIIIPGEVVQKTEIELLIPGAHGIDISHHNGKVNLSLVKKDQSFIFMKATEGVSLVSLPYHKRMEEALALKIPCGAYHFYRPNKGAVAQAKHFCRNIKGNLPPVLDIESEYSNRNKLIEDLKLFLSIIEDQTGQIPIIYSYYDYLKNLNLPKEFSRYPLWLAWYTNESAVKVPSPWNHITFWQYSDQGIVNGVEGKCDVNIFKGIKNEGIFETRG